MKILERIIGVVVVITTLAYPALVYIGLGRVDPLWMCAALMGIALLRIIVSRQLEWLWVVCGVFILSTISVWQKSWIPLKFYPVVVNFVLFVFFLLSLRFGRPVIERIARLQESDLSSIGIKYTRQVTIIWCLFFIFNGTLAAITATWCSNEVWVLYNGLISYILIGFVFGVEWLVRRRVRGAIRYVKTREDLDV